MYHPEPKFTFPKLAAAAANEGIPVAAIARILDLPANEVYQTLAEAKAVGTIIEVPKPDWPPTARLADRLPTVARPISDADLAFQCRQIFKLTALEAGFLVVLLKHERVEKTKLHNIVEQQRMTRNAQPNTLEATDPKMVDVMICKLRKKLKAVDEGFVIDTIWGGGYHMKTDVKSAILDHMQGGPSDTQEAPHEKAALSLPA